MKPENIDIQYASEKLIPSFHSALDLVAREKIYIEMIEAPPLDKVIVHQQGLMQKKFPIYYAVTANQVVGFCDVTPFSNPRFSHRGGLGMGLLPDFRGKGLGSRLLESVVQHSRNIGMEKIELQVYTQNLPAIGLYKKYGFEEEGLVKKFRKLEGEYFDCLAMAKFL